MSDKQKDPLDVLTEEDRRAVDLIAFNNGSGEIGLSVFDPDTYKLLTIVRSLCARVQKAEAELSTAVVERDDAWRLWSKAEKERDVP